MPETSTLNLIILGVAIILVMIVYQNVVSQDDTFSGKVPMVPIGGNPYLNFLPQGVQPTGQPMMYQNQYYPAKFPYYNDAINNYGRPCDQINGCGVMGSCVDGTCTITDEKNTVFDLKI